MKNGVLMLVVGLFFIVSPAIQAQSWSSKFHSSEWKGTDIDGISNAEFKDFNSKEKITYELKKGDTFNLKYNINIKKGTFSIQIESKKAGVIYEKEVTAIQSDALHFNSNEKDKITITLSGEGASGSFDIQYGENFSG